MGVPVSNWTVYDLVEDYKSGRMPRRTFIGRLAGIGISGGIIAAILSGCGGPREAAGGPAIAASTDFQPKQRGGGGLLKILSWTAPSLLNPHLSTGGKDLVASGIFYEQLIYLDADANLVPRLALEVPSIDNGTRDKEGKWVIWKLKENVKWHDGEPFTADDVVFTWEFATDPETVATSQGAFMEIKSVEKVDALTIRVAFGEPTMEWYSPWNRASGGQIIPRHIFEPHKGRNARSAPENLKPVGTNAYKIVEFRPDDLVLADINRDYHIENRPFFDRVECKGGGDAFSAARAVVETGEYDFAWNLGPAAFQAAGSERDAQNMLHAVKGGTVTFIDLNHSDPNVQVDGERSSVKAAHPFFSDLKVRQAFSLAIDRKAIVDHIYSHDGEVAHYLVYIPEKYVPEALWQKDVSKANQLLDETGWLKGADGKRAKSGKQMKVLFQTSVGKATQDAQIVIKKDLEAIGVEVELKAVISDVFFADDPSNPDNLSHFYADMQMFSRVRSGPDSALALLQGFLSTEVKQKSNKWAPRNETRYVSKQFDALYAEAAREMDPVRFADAVKKMNQWLFENAVLIPLVARRDVSAVKSNLKGTQLSGWASELWALPFWWRA